MLIATTIEKMIDFYEGNIHDIACPLCRENTGIQMGNIRKKKAHHWWRHFNAGESGYSKKSIENFCKKIFHTDTGTRLLKSMYLEKM